MSNWKDTLATVAPTIAAALGGPLAGAAVRTLADVLGVAPSEDDIADIVAAGDHETLLALKEADHTFRLKMRELGIKEDQLYLEDTQSARRAYVSHKDRMVPWLAAIVVLGFFSIVVLVLAGQFHVSGALAGTLVGYVSAKAEQVISFYFGSSQGSKAKTDALASALAARK